MGWMRSEEIFTQRRRGRRDHCVRAIDEISGDVIGASMAIHRELGPGLLINFGYDTLKEGVKRVVNNHQD